MTIAVRFEGGCAFDGAGKLHCWPAELGRTFSGTFRSVSGGGRICALATVIKCDPSGIRTCVWTEPVSPICRADREVESSAGVRRDRLATSKSG
jgi:hypothetical protein